jgi:membrane protease YdiL (CAAX protease family)
VRTFLLGVAIGAATIFAVVAAGWAAGAYHAAGYVRAFASPSALGGIAVLLLAFAVQSSVEEILVRGWLLSVAVRKFNTPAAVALTSVVFAFLHFSPGQAWLITLNVLLFSVFACCWALKTGNVWGVMGWHAGWNWLLATGFEVPVTGLDAGLPALLVTLRPTGPDWLTGGAQGPEGSVFCTVFFLVGIAVTTWRRGAPADRGGAARTDR